VHGAIDYLVDPASRRHSPFLSMATHAFLFFGFADTQQYTQVTQKDTASQGGPPTAQFTANSDNSSSSEQQDSSEETDFPEFALQRNRRRLSTIKEESEDDLARNSPGQGKRRSPPRRVSLQKGHWIIPKGEATSPPIDEQKQSGSVQAHISSPPRSPEEGTSDEMGTVEGVEGFQGWDQ
jgi:hypothetical protein